NNGEPALVIIDDAAQRVEHERAFEVLVFRGGRVNAAPAQDGLLVFDLGLEAVEVFDGRRMAPAVFDIERFKVSGPALMNPHVGAIGGGDAVAEPLVRALVDDDEIKLEAPGSVGPVAVEITVGEAVSV